MTQEVTPGRVAAAVTSGIAAGSVGFKAGLLVGSPLGPLGSAVCGLIGFHCANWFAVNRSLAADNPYQQAAMDAARLAAGAVIPAPTTDCPADRTDHTQS